MALDPRRDTDVTGSDVPAICGESSWGTKSSVMYKKIFKLRSPDTEATLHGKRLEPVAIRRFCETTGAKVEYPGYVKHSAYSWFGATVDGVATMPDGSRCVIEIKCPLRRKITDEVPIQYVGQVQVYLEILNMDLCLFVQYKPAGPRKAEELCVTPVRRDRRYMAARLPSLRRFWGDMTAKHAYAIKVVVAMQRAWKAEGCKKASTLRIGCFMARVRLAIARKSIEGFEVPPNGSPDTLICVELPVRYVPPERTRGVCYVSLIKNNH
jgi:putative phage-type endonuclease